MELSYIAGFFDGEGMIRINRSMGKYYSLQCVVVNTDLKPLKYIQQIFGGTIAERKKYKSHHKTSYRWRVTSNDAKNFLEKIYPWLITKKEQALIGIDFQNNMKKFGGRFSTTPESVIKNREDVFEKLKLLKH